MESYILYNIYAGNEDTMKLLRDNFLKTIPYQKLSNFVFNNVLIQYPVQRKFTPEFSDFVISHCEELKDEKSLDKYYGAFKFYETIKKFLKPDDEMRFSISEDSNILTFKDFGISYTDGSSLKNGVLKAGWSLTKIGEGDFRSSSHFNDIVGDTVAYSEHFGQCSENTNIVGELTAIYKAAEAFDDKKIQMIVSDSEYSIKCQREWIFTWMANGFHGSSGSNEVAHKDMITKIYNTSNYNGRIVLYKWIKGHSGDFFNELCDKNAKKGAEKQK